MTTTDTEVPDNVRAAADWLRGRHAVLDHLVTRACGPLEDNPHWVGDICDAFTSMRRDTVAWEKYKSAHREPTGDDTDAEWEVWRSAGPDLLTAAGKAIAPMSSGEVQLLRLITTLGDSWRRPEQGWQVNDISLLDDRFIAVVEDWLRIVRRVGAIR